ncbi:methyl-accepting chemotaxis protein [Novosphingobium sp. KCTC 2891]|uniref:methyl-accepting chemotaxis protein n=1 Tax=Novosphingobium sp. KCTC 2891 TaxID=2989730 RepID=UPI00222314BC|nr:methyl-accepting chemotaxis protein [Novosphingobium sp. KCTC 2891]MCW1383353.1 methyl-accepting chemotaxis protein [Novosphingobium sp. KCTC 2891]
MEGTDTVEDLDILRRRGVMALAVVGWLCVVLAGLRAAFGSGGWIPPLLALAITIAPTMFARAGRCDAAARLVLGFTIPLYPAIFLMQWAGSDWILDQHMIFFAIIATLAGLADWRPIVLAAAVTAVHHLATNFLAPSLVFPDGPDTARVLLHAVVVVIETAVLAVVARQLETLVIEQAAARQAQADLEAAAAAERARTAAEQKQVIEALATRLKTLAEGDLATHIDTAFPASYEALRQTLNAATTDLNRLVCAVNGSAHQITNGAAEIRNASDDLARRTEQQASALEQNSASTGRLTGQIETTAKRAGDVNGAITAAQADAVNGGQVVERAIDAMNAIERSASEIGQIISLIDGIAFQTNLLALNAGVEAARAGDAGRGFAVVATEVRALAQRSADAAQTIKQLITASSQQVGQGVALVGETGTVLRAIVEQVTGISSAIGEIADAAETQARDLHDVSRSFSQIDKVTQQNAAMVEESNAAAHNLSREADGLTRLVSRFRTDDSARAGSADAFVRRAA